jgi:hypothetical protein
MSMEIRDKGWDRGAGPALAVALNVVVVLGVLTAIFGLWLLAVAAAVVLPPAALVAARTSRPAPFPLEPGVER